MENTHNFYAPKYNLMGIGCIKDLVTLLLPYKLSKMLIITDQNMIQLGIVEQVETMLKSLFITYDIFDGAVHTNATITFVEDAYSYFEKGFNIFKRKYDMVISIGGGTSHDCAKAVAVLAENGGSISDYEGFNKMQKPSLPHIAINTTSGTGSQISMYTIITDESRKVKMTLGDARMTPMIAVNDPLFMYSMPKNITAATGIDALSHSIESYFSLEASPVTDSLALGAAGLVFKYLERAFENGNDMEAREKMMFADNMAGLAFNSGGLGYVHAMAHQIGGFYNTLHGITNAILLPYVLEFNSVSFPDEKFFPLAEAMGIKARNKSSALDKIITAIEDLKKSLDLPTKLSQIGAKRQDLKSLSANAMKDISVFTNPRKATLEEMENLFNEAY